MAGKKLTSSATSEIQSFLDHLAKVPAVTSKASAGRLIFALDATASREPTWRTACRLQSEMFDVAGSLGGLELQLCYYRGLDEFQVSRWLTTAEALKAEMSEVGCLGGYTQIARVLKHAVAETKRQRVGALVLIGDCMEEDVDLLCRQAGEMGLLGVPAFLFQEGTDANAELAFRQIARLTRGAYSRFDSASAQQLRELLGAAASYAAGGLQGLDDYGRKTGGAALQLRHQLKPT